MLMVQAEPGGKKKKNSNFGGNFSQGQNRFSCWVWWERSNKEKENHPRPRREKKLGGNPCLPKPGGEGKKNHLRKNFFRIRNGKKKRYSSLVARPSAQTHAEKGEGTLYREKRRGHHGPIGENPFPPEEVEFLKLRGHGGRVCSGEEKKKTPPETEGRKANWPAVVRSLRRNKQETP